MTIRVRCDRCGKVSTFSDADVGLTALCMACGARFTIPEGIPDENAVEGSSVSVLVTWAGAPPAAPAIRPMSKGAGIAAPAAGVISGTPWGVFWGLLGGALLAVGALVVVLILVSRPGWEERNRTALRDLKARGDAMVLAGRTKEAVETYDQLLALTRDRSIGDPRLRADLEQAKSARDRMFERFLAQGEGQVARVNPEPATTHRTQRPDAQVAENAQSKTDSSQTPSPAPKRDETASGAGGNEPKTGGGGGDPMAALASLLEYYSDPEKFIEKYANPKRSMDARPPQPKAVEAIPRENPTTDQAAIPSTNPSTNPVIPPTNPSVLVVRRLEPPAELVTDAEIGQSIQRGVDWMIGQFEDGKLITSRAGGDNAYYSGLNALCVYALLQSSYAVKDERLNLKGDFVKKLVAVMKDSPMEMGPVTYARAIRSTALSLIDRKEDKAALAADVKYLLASHINGAYTYQMLQGLQGRSPRSRMGGAWDNSNAQYGLLGVWSAAEVGAEVNNAYWQAVEQHWTTCQLEDGSWGYSGYNSSRGGRLSMSVAGIASLFVTHDYLDAPKFGSAVGRQPFSPALKKGLEWLESGERAVSPDSGYTLYGIERVGLASGFKFLGDHDWYRVLARKVIDNQHSSGTWGSELETAYNLLFLARGRHPILMNKLRFNGYWANRPRDVANLTRFASRELERPLNWQVVPVEREWTEWTDSPVLYVASHAPPKLDQPERDKIRSFVAAGGLLFTQSDGNKPEMDAWAQELAATIFRPYELVDMPDDHEIYQLHYRLSPENRPKLKYVTNGSRILMVHSPSDLTQHWQLRAEKSKRAVFELGVNLFLYASGKADLRNRVTSSYIAPLATPAAGGAVNVVRLRYPGNWNPEPMAWTRFSRYLQLETDVGLNLAPLDLADVTILKSKTATLAHLTGTHAHTFTGQQINAVRQFVEGGGVLVIDPCGGGEEFLDSARLMLGRGFPEQRLAPLRPEHPLLSASSAGMVDARTPRLRPYLKTRAPGLIGRMEILSAGKGRVIVCPLDVTTGLLGANTWGIAGYDPGYASALMKNVVLWSAGGMPEK
jgi:hypothetical protein